MAGNRRISLRQLKEHLRYDAATGIFRWKSRVRGRAVGSIAGCINPTDGYRRILFRGRQYAAHRLAWLYVYGRWPRSDLDHVNGTKDDNRASIKANGKRIFLGLFLTAEEAHDAYCAAAKKYFGEFARAA
jgi:hypothetical protein